MEKTRVVITGLGMVSPLGLNVKQSWEAALAARSGVKKIDIFDASEYRSQISGSVRGFDATEYLDAKQARKLELFIQYAIAASEQAFEDSGLEITDANAHRVGALIGSGIGGLPMIEENCQLLLKSGPRRISPFFIPGAIINMASGFLSIRKGLKGPTMSIVTACTTGSHSIGQAARMIAYGDADVMVAGGAEMATCPLGLGGFASMRALSTRNDQPQQASRPWDKDRDGFVLGDGAGSLILESYEHAKQRGAKIYAELVGFGMSSDAYHMTLPDPDAIGFCASMQNALNDAGLAREAVDYINAHATATPAGDVLEAKGIKKLFAAHADNLAVSSTKSMTGHLLGAAGAIEAIFTVMAICDNVAPPTINLDNPDEGCDLNFVPHQPQQRQIDVAMSNSFGFGGTNGTLIFKRLT